MPGMSPDDTGMPRSSSPRLMQAAAAVIAAAVLFTLHPPAAADDRESENIFWQSIRESTNPADFEAYLVQYKDGTYATLARNRLAQLKAQPPAVDPDRNTIAAKLEQALISALADERVAHQGVASQLAAVQSQLSAAQRYAAGLERDLAKLRETPTGQEQARIEDLGKQLADERAARTAAAYQLAS